MIIRCIKADEQRKRKTQVAVYCRVSTKRTEQEDSLATQKSVYQNRIALRSDWELVDIYADALSGLSAEKRPDFMRLIEDCKKGKVDRILCKSVSRFSRNVTECQRFVELLRSMNIVVEFEKENIRTDDPTSNLLFALMCSIAQDESRSISENVRMGIQAKYKRGEFNLGSNRILGYDTVNGKLTPNEDAWIVKMIFDLFLEGKTFKQISEQLCEAGAESLRKSRHFAPSTISNILRNETYVGDKLLYKEPPRDFITKRKLWASEYQSYYLEDDHEPIVDRESWNTVQKRLNQNEEQKKMGLKVRGKPCHFLFGKVRCGECGELYTRRTFRDKAKSAKQDSYKAWTCKSKNARSGEKSGKGRKCSNHMIREEVLLQQIAKKLGWDAFDETLFHETVDCVVIGKKGIRIELKE